MKKFVAMMLFAITIMSLMLGCSSEPEKEINAKDVVDVLVASGLQIDTATMQVYDEESDPNELLGRPDQYTSKVSFDDSRHLPEPGELEFIDEYIPNSTVEVFKNKSDCTKRNEYISGIAEVGGIFAQYIYQNDNMLLRLDHALTPTEAKEYEDVFMGLDKKSIISIIEQVE